jgi:hypothetical protein
MKRLVASLLLLAALLPCPALAGSQDKAPLPPETRKELNNFMSPFAASNMANFDQATLTDEALLDFAVWSCILRPDPALKRTRGGQDIVIPSRAIDDITQGALGRTIKKHPKTQYVESLASGEVFVFAQVDSLRPGDDGTFLAAGTIYYAGAGETVDPQASRAQWKRAGADVRVQGTFTGVLRQNDDPRHRWTLLQYAVKDTQ